MHSTALHWPKAFPIVPETAWTAVTSCIVCCVGFAAGSSSIVSIVSKSIARKNKGWKLTVMSSADFIPKWSSSGGICLPQNSWNYPTSQSGDAAKNAAFVFVTDLAPTPSRTSTSRLLLMMGKHGGPNDIPKKISNSHKLFPFIGGRGTQWFGLSSNTVSYIYIYFYWKLEKEPNHCLEVPARGSHTHTYIHTRINNDTIHTVYIYIYNQVASSHLSKNSCNIAKHLCIWNLLVSWYCFLGSMWVLDQDRRSCWIQFGIPHPIRSI